MVDRMDNSNSGFASIEACCVRVVVKHIMCGSVGLVLYTEDNLLCCVRRCVETA